MKYEPITFKAYPYPRSTSRRIDNSTDFTRTWALASILVYLKATEPIEDVETEEIIDTDLLETANGMNLDENDEPTDNMSLDGGDVTDDTSQNENNEPIDDMSSDGGEVIDDMSQDENNEPTDDMSLDGGDATNDMNLDRAETVTDRMSQDENNEPNDENEEVTNEMNQMNLMSK